MSTQPIIALVDCNNFYVSCERLFRPDLWDKPVAVLSNLDGCLISRSKEVKSLLIPMAIPVFKVAHLVKKTPHPFVFRKLPVIWRYIIQDHVVVGNILAPYRNLLDR